MCGYDIQGWRIKVLNLVIRHTSRRKGEIINVGVVSMLLESVSRCINLLNAIFESLCKGLILCVIQVVSSFVVADINHLIVPASIVLSYQRLAHEWHSLESQRNRLSRHVQHH